MKNFAFGIFSILGVIFFGGCQLYNDVLKPDKIEEKYIQATRKGEILNGLKTEAVVVATRLNEFDEKFNSDEGEYFFVDIYISEDSKNFYVQGLKNPLYSIQLSNGVAPLKIERLNSDELLKYNFTFASRWGEYFLVKFPPQSPRYRDQIQLEIIHKNLGKMTLDYGFKNIKK